MGGVVKTENPLLFAKKHIMKGVLKNCKDVPCKITTFKETNANDIGCAKAKVVILHGTSLQFSKTPFMLCFFAKSSRFSVLTTPPMQNDNFFLKLMFFWHLLKFTKWPIFDRGLRF